ncbi:MAG TPA: hypothetical protein PKE12_13665 [Kiritimatiellia bacterium]|nr:hypothetical protein [Kiritimatiellia bacterium]
MTIPCGRPGSAGAWAGIGLCLLLTHAAASTHDIPTAAVVREEHVTVNAARVLRTQIPATAFSGINVSHASSVRAVYPSCSKDAIRHRPGVLRETFEAVGLRGLRYPGGTFAEETYDYFDQGGTGHLATAGCDPGTNRLDTVADVLAFCKAFQAEPYFIVPTKRFFAGHNGNPAHQFDAAAAYAFDAVRMTVATGEALGAPRVRYWDIGNEVYEPEFDPSDYARFAGHIALAIKAADPRARTVVNVAPQHKNWNFTAASNIVRTLKSNPVWWDSVDAFTMHILNAGPTNWGGDSIHGMTMVMRSIFEDKEVLFTAISPSSWSGQWAANGLLSTYEQVLRAGTDHVVSWPTAHQSASGRLWHVPQGLTPSGLAMNWLIEAAMSNAMVETSHTDGNPIKAMAFRDGSERLTVFLMGKHAGARRVQLAINSFASGYVRETRLTGYAGAPKHDFIRTETRTRTGNPLSRYETTINRDSNYEVLRLEFSPTPFPLWREDFSNDSEWTTYNNPEFVAASGGLTPLAGERMFRFNTSAPRRNAAACKPWALLIQPGLYTFTFQCGHDGGAPPFARGRVNVGFFGTNAAPTAAVDVQDAIHSWGAQSGVVRQVASFPHPSNAWATWHVTYRVESNSPAVGQRVMLGVHAQSGATGAQALIDDLVIELPETPADAHAVIHADTPLAYVDPLMFGVNLVFSRQPLDAAYSNAFREAGMRMLRYPGGTVTESEFDFRQPTAPHPSLADAITFCTSVDAELMLVVPTKRFATNVAAGARYAAEFVRAVNIDKAFGNRFVRYWELGNEYYAGGATHSISVQAYKELADQMAAAMVAVDPRIVPIVQFRRSSDSTDMQVIADHLAASTNRGHVRAILTHVYPGTNAFMRMTQTTIPAQLKLGRSVFSNDLLFVTEWNVSSGARQRGMRLANHLPALFDALLRGGARGATLWPMSWQLNGVGTALADVRTGALRPPGQAMAWLAEAAADGHLVQTSVPHPRCSVSAYRQPDRMTIFISGRDLPVPTTMKLAVEGFAFTSIEAHRMSARNEHAHAPASITPAPVQRSGSDVQVQINALNPWELVRVILRP